MQVHFVRWQSSCCRRERKWKKERKSIETKQMAKTHPPSISSIIFFYCCRSDCPCWGLPNIIIDVLDPCWKCAPLLLFCDERKGRQGIFIILLSLFFPIYKFFISNYWIIKLMWLIDKPKFFVCFFFCFFFSSGPQSGNMAPENVVRCCKCHMPSRRHFT